MTHDDEAPSNNLDGFRMQNLRKPAAIVAVTHQDDDDEFDEMPFTTKLSKPKQSMKQPIPKKEQDTQQLVPLSVRANQDYYEPPAKY